MSFVKTKWFACISSVLVLAGTVALFFAFQTTSSDFRFVTTRWNTKALCADNKVLVESFPNGGWRIGSNACPDWEKANPAAVVKVENPLGVWAGFGLLVLGSVMQVFASLVGPKTEAELRAELRAIRKAEK